MVISAALPRQGKITKPEALGCVDTGEWVAAAAARAISCCGGVGARAPSHGCTSDSLIRHDQTVVVSPGGPVDDGPLQIWQCVLGRRTLALICG
jgi:hypothetical protein